MTRKTKAEPKAQGKPKDPPVRLRDAGFGCPDIITTPAAEDERPIDDATKAEE